MAQLAVAVAGGVIGAYFGSPEIGFMIGSVVGSFLFPNKPPAATEIPLSVSTWGQGIPILYGTARLPGNMIWAAEMRNKKSAFGKGSLFSGVPQVTTTRSLAMAFCEGPTDNVIRLWADGQLVYDSLFTGSVAKGYAINYYFHRGVETELPEPLIELWVAQNVPDAPFAVPAYRGLSYLMFPDFPISLFGNRIPSLTAEISNSSVAVAPWVQLSLMTNASAGVTATAGGIAVDWVRGVFYSAPGSAIRAINLNDNSEQQQILVPQISSGSAISSGQGGFIYASSGNGNGSAIYSIDPNSLQALFQFGVNNSDFSNHPTNFGFTTQITVIDVANSSGNTEYAVCSSILGLVGVLKGVQLIYAYGDSTELSYVHFTYESLFGRTTTCAGAKRTGSSDCWLLNWADTGGTTIDIGKMVLSGSSGFDTISLLSTGVSVTKEAILTSTDFGISGSTSLALNSVVFDQTDGTLIISASGSSGNGSIKWDPSSSSVVWVSSLFFSLDPNSQLTTGTLGWVNGPTQFIQISTATGAVLFSDNALNPPGWVNTPNQPPIYDSTTSSLVYPDHNNDPYYRVYLNQGSSSGYPLASIIQDVCARCGLQPTQVDTSLITQDVAGYTITRNTTGKDVLAQLAQAYFFDIVESDYTLKFVPRGTTSIATIPQDDLGDAKSAGPGDYLVRTKGNPVDTPIQFQINFKDLDNDYLPNAAYWKRMNAPAPTVFSKQKAIIDIPLALHLSDATIIAQTWTSTVWQELARYETTLGWQYLWLDPADNVTIDLDNGSTYTVRLMTIDTGANFTLQLQGVGEDIQTYSQATTIQDVTSPYVGVMHPISFGQLFILNVPLLRDQDDTGGSASAVYYGAGSFQPNWAGAELYQSVDGENFTQFQSIQNTVTWGTVITVLGDTDDPFSTDRVNALTVSLGMQQADLVSASYLDWLNGANAILVGSEIIQFQTATLNADFTYTLSTLLRGRRGTEWATGIHTVGELFVVLDTNLYESTIPLSQINATLYWKLVPLGTFPDTAATTSKAFLGYDLKPYAPNEIERAPSGSDLLVTWIRRSRLGGALLDGTGSVPLAEETESYDAYVLSAPYNEVAANWATPVSPVRSFLGLTSPQFTYTAAEMSTDGFVPASGTLHVVVFQNSAAIGHGWPGSGDLPPF